MNALFIRTANSILCEEEKKKKKETQDTCKHKSQLLHFKLNGFFPVNINRLHSISFAALEKISLNMRCDAMRARENNGYLCIFSLQYAFAHVGMGNTKCTMISDIDVKTTLKLFE